MKEERGDRKRGERRQEERREEERRQEERRDLVKFEFFALPLKHTQSC